MNTPPSKPYSKVSIYLALASFHIANVAFASPTGGAGLPYEAPIRKYLDSLTGIVAWSVAVICLLGALYHAAKNGGELSAAVWGLAGPIIVCSCLVAIKALMQFVGQGAVIASPMHTAFVASASQVFAGLPWHCG